MMAHELPIPDWRKAEEDQRRFAEEEAETKSRELANDLLACPAFRKWATEMMLNVGYFGEGREMSAFEQGRRSAIVRMFETICEAADDGDNFIKEAFRTLLETKKNKER